MRWLALVGLIVGATLAFVGPWMDWLAADVAIDYIDGLERPMVMALTGWLGFALLLVVVAAAFAMLVGARRNYLPRTALFVAALASSVGSALTVATIWLVRGAMHDARGVRYTGEYRYIFQEPHPLHLTSAPYLQLAGFLITAGAAWWLNSIARRIVLDTAAELARLQRAQAIRDGDVGAEALPVVEEPVPKL